MVKLAPKFHRQFHMADFLFGLSHVPSGLLVLSWNVPDFIHVHDNQLGQFFHFCRGCYWAIMSKTNKIYK